MDYKKMKYYESLIPEISEEEWLHHKVMTDELARRIILPISWQEMRISMNSPLYGIKAYLRNDQLQVLFSYINMEGKPWLHVSLSRPKKIPSYEDMYCVKQIFIGDDLQAVQIFPKKEKHLNINEYVLHLWCALEGDGLPDFGKYGTI